MSSATKSYKRQVEEMEGEVRTLQAALQQREAQGQQARQAGAALQLELNQAGSLHSCTLCSRPPHLTMCRRRLSVGAHAAGRLSTLTRSGMHACRRGVTGMGWSATCRGWRGSWWP